MTADLLTWFLQASGAGNLNSHKQQFMLRVADKNVQFDTHKVALKNPA
ncbi:hypothetical protein [Pseudomonas sp. KBW05]|nr:hypothetical protein [Pseudomonas sp. KBW05]